MADELRQLTPDEAAEVQQRIRTRTRLARRPSGARTSADVIGEPPAAAEPDQAPPGPPARAQRRSRPASAPPPASSAGTSTPATSSPRWVPSGSAPTVVDDGAGFLLGVLAWALTLAYLRGGPAGARDWIRAKFTNKRRDGSWLP